MCANSKGVKANSQDIKILKMFTSDQNKLSSIYACTLDNENNHIEQIFVKSLYIFGLRKQYQIYLCQLSFVDLIFIIQLNRYMEFI